MQSLLISDRRMVLVEGAGSAKAQGQDELGMQKSLLTLMLKKHECGWKGQERRVEKDQGDFLGTVSH